MGKLIFAGALAATVFMQTMPAHAYIDPGTGTLIVQSIIGSVAAALTIAGIYSAKIRKRIKRLLSRDSSDKAEEPHS